MARTRWVARVAGVLALAWGAPAAAPGSVQAHQGSGRPVVHLGGEILRVGVEAGSPDQEFGLVGAALLFPPGHLTVLDSRLNTVRTFDLSGRAQGRAGRPGSGPGEFRYPKAAIATEPTELYVLDGMKAEVIRFSWGESGWRFLDGRRIERVASPDAFCRLGDLTVIAVHMASDSAILRTYDREGRFIRSIGRPVGGGGPLREAAMSRYLKVVCEPELGLIMVGGEWGPEVRAYKADGTLAWTTTVPGFRGVRLEDRPGGRIAFIPPTGGRGAEVETHAVLARTGQHLGVQRDLPLIAEATRNHLVTFSNADVPHVSVREYRVAREAR